MIKPYEIFETLKMIEKENLDIRTITMGISLRDCIDSDIDKLCNNVYKKIIKYASNLVRTGNDIESEYGIPIINKRVSVTPISLIGEACASEENYIKLAKTLDRAANDIGVDFLGGYSALVHKGFTKGDSIFIKTVSRALSETKKVCSSINIATTSAGINMDAVKKMGDIIKEASYLTKDMDSIACAKLVVFANAPEDNPFMAGAFHGIGEAESTINVGVSGPGVIKKALEKVKGEDLSVVAETIKKTAFKITRAGQMVAREASKRLDTRFGIIDLSLAPTPAVGDSVAYILEEIGLEKCGTHGTTAALAILNDAVKKGGVMASSHVGGLSGAFIPVSEDAGMIEAVKSGALSIEKLEAMTCVCSVGLDMVVVPGDTPSETLAAIIADEAAIGVVNNKTTAVRIIPAYNKKLGDIINFGGLLGSGPVMKLNSFKSNEFIKRGGRIPAPLASLRN